jgi:hypothetical protein
MSDYYDYDAAIAEFIGPTAPSLNSVASKYGIPESSLRREVKLRGIVRGGASERKRRIVEGHFAGEVANELASAEAVQANIEAEAARDVEDMNDALDVSRQALKRLKTLMDGLADPREIKAAIEATARAVEVIRKIRGLDAPTDFSDWSDDELLLLAQSGRMPAGRR